MNIIALKGLHNYTCIIDDVYIMDFTMVFFNEVLRYINLKTTCFCFVLGSLQTCLKPAFFSPPSIYPNLIQLATIPKLHGV